MADITIYKPANLTISVVDGEDPSPALRAQVEALQAQVASLAAERDAAMAAVVDLQAKIFAAKAALA
jgi:hypothetical protein